MKSNEFSNDCTIGLSGSDIDESQDATIEALILFQKTMVWKPTEWQDRKHGNHVSV